MAFGACGGGTILVIAGDPPIRRRREYRVLRFNPCTPGHNHGNGHDWCSSFLLFRAYGGVTTLVPPGMIVVLLRMVRLLLVVPSMSSQVYNCRTRKKDRVLFDLRWYDPRTPGHNHGHRQRLR